MGRCVVLALISAVLNCLVGMAPAFRCVSNANQVSTAKMVALRHHAPLVLLTPLPAHNTSTPASRAVRDLPLQDAERHPTKSVSPSLSLALPVLQEPIVMTAPPERHLREAMFCNALYANPEQCLGLYSDRTCA